MHRNPGASIDFGGGVIKDAGRDGGGVYRNISRDLRIPDFLTKGEQSSLSWPQVCKCLPAQNPEDRVNANIIDTIILSDAEAKLYLYTTREGFIAQKPRNMHDLRRIRDQFLNYVPILQPDGHRFVAVMALEGEEAKSLGNDAFSNLCLGATPKNLEMLQCFMPSKGDSTSNVTYRTDYWLERSAQIAMRTERVGLDPSVSGSSHVSARSNMNRKLNVLMETWTQKVANRVQSVYKGRVMRMTLEFVQDTEGKVWLSKSTECVVSTDSYGKRESQTSEMLKRSRTEVLVAGARSGSPDRAGLSASRGDDRIGVGSPISRPSSIGHHSDARISRRRRREESGGSMSPGGGAPDGFVEDSSLGGSFFGGNYQLDTGSSLTFPDISSRPGSKGQSRESSRFVLESCSELPTEVPNSRLGKEVPLAESATAIFGTTQLKGCQGDFCHIRADMLEDPTIVGGRQSHKSLSKFRRRLMEADTSQFGAVDDASFGNSYEELDDAAATSIILGNSLNSGGSGAKSKPTRKSQANRRQDGDSDGAKNPEATLLIPYRAIIQARQEMPLVKAMLLRRKNKESGDYATTDNYHDLAVSGKLPAVYYTEVPCCPNCAQVYQIIDTARNKAMRKISNKRQREKVDDPILVMQLEALSAPLDSMPRQSSKSPNKKLNKNCRPMGDSSRFDISSSLPGEMDSGSIGSADLRGDSLASKGSVWVNDTSSKINRRNDASNMISSSANMQYEEKSRASLLVAAEAIEGLTKLDVAELRSMQKPPAAVEVVLEAVMGLLTGKLSSFHDTRRLLGGGEAFLTMLRDFRLGDVTDSRLRMVEPYVDNPVFRPENVLPVSACAAKFCSWVLGVVQAARWQRHIGHHRTDFLPGGSEERSRSQKLMDTNSLMSASIHSVDEGQMTFVEKLEKRRAKRSKLGSDKISAPRSPEMKKKRTVSDYDDLKKPSHTDLENPRIRLSANTAPYPISREADSSIGPLGRSRASVPDAPSTMTSSTLTLRERTAVQAAQKQATTRLASQNKSEGGGVGTGKEFRCRDGITRMPYIVLGKMSLEVKRCNLIIVHDFFDTCDGTAIAFKPITQRHDGSQVLCFNYPGQSNTVWPRPSPVERQRGAREPVLNNDWVADRLHELLQGAEQRGDFLLTNPFHVVGFGNGAAIAAAFAQRWGSDPLYSSSIRSVVSVNGFLYPDAQLSAILHSAQQLFETTPHSRPDIPVSYWAKYLFSNEYLERVNPNLALNIHTAVANPITNDGRAKIARGCLQHRDIRGGLAPDFVPKVKATSKGAPAYATSQLVDAVSTENLCPVSVPVIILQSTENSLVNASNVDSFLIGRTTKHLWSHQLNAVSSAAIATASDPSGQWVGKLSKTSEDYAKFSSLGKNGLRMLLESIDNPRGAFVLWCRAGHAVMQENKSVVLDLVDALCCPTAEYFGINTAQQDKNRFQRSAIGATSSAEAHKKSVVEFNDEDVLFKLSPPKERALSPNAVSIRHGEDFVDEAKSTLDDSNVEITDSAMTGSRGISDVIFAEVESKKTVPDAKTAMAEPTGQQIVSVENENTRQGSEPETDTVSASMPASGDVASSSTVVPVGDMDRSIEGSTSLVPDVGLVRHPDNPRPTLPVIMTFDAPVTELPEPHIVPDIRDLSRYTEVEDMVSTRDQRLKKKWSETIPDAKTSLALEKELDLRHQDLMAKEAALKETQSLEAEARIARIQQEQAQRRQNYESEDTALLEKLESDLQQRRLERVAAERQRKVELLKMEEKLVSDGIVDAYIPPDGESGPVPEINPQMFTKPPELPAQMRERKDPVSTMDQLVIDEEIARKKGIMSLEEFDRVKKQMALSQLDREQKLRDREDEEELAFWGETAITIQRVARGIQGRERARAVKKVRDTKITVEKGVLQFQALTRGITGRRRARFMKKLKLQNLLLGASILKIQCASRAFLSRRFVRMLRRRRAATNIQRTFRGYLGILVVKRERARLEIIRRKGLASSKIQSIWRMKVAKEEFRSLRIHALAVLEIQRSYRGYLGRKKMKRRREWESATPGPERIKLGLQLIEESKVAFERQQEEIDALHRAQERAEARVSHIHSELKDSEKELVVLERELQEIDQIERDLQNLTHEKDLITRGISDAAGVSRSAVDGNEDAILGKPPGVGVADMTPEQQRKLKADAYALEMTIQIKRAEREKKRQELESEFATVFHDVEKKKQALERLESSLVDMESTRERKDREFRRLQQNLMQLLMEQKLELDSLREKGIELETATATSAAAATATAMKAKEHEKRSTAMFSQTEELMKFQFMSMSLSYFSSLNMLKQLRDMNADTTSTAVTSSAEAAAAAATSAVAANLPNIKKLDLKGADYVKLSAKKKKEELTAHEKAEKEVKTSNNVVMPNNIRMWTVDDVAKWMESLSLGQYADAFREATVDGPFLLELREEDLVQVLGVSHKLHVRKILVSREKLKPLSEQEKAMKDQVEYEGKADERRRNMGVPDLETVFSQGRNGRTKRLEESLNLGFPINGEDGKGNTLLLIACQNSNKRMVEMLVTRGANVNHQNAVGNSALHFSMSFDPEGQIGEYLIAHGADDTLENVEGLTPYDGLGNAGGNF